MLANDDRYNEEMLSCAHSCQGYISSEDSEKRERNLSS